MTIGYGPYNKTKEFGAEGPCEVPLSTEESLVRAQFGAMALAGEEQPVATIGLMSLIDIYYDSGCDTERAHELFQSLGEVCEGAVHAVSPLEEEQAADEPTKREDVFAVQETLLDPRRLIVRSRSWG